LDNIAWSCNEGEGAGFYFERMRSGDGIIGGMGGGATGDDLWVNNEFVIYEDQIKKVLSGEIESLQVH